MKNTIIKIGGRMLDLYPGTVVTQSLKGFSIGDIQSRFVNFTNRFRAPRTMNNDSIFENAGNPDSNTDIPYEQQEATIQQNGIDTVVNGVHSIDNVDRDYNLSIFSGAKSFFDIVSAKKLSELTGFAVFSDPANVAIDVSAKRNATSGIIYPVAYSGTYDTPADILAGWLSGIYLKSIVDAIFAQSGYDKSGNVFSDTKYLKKVVMCMGNGGSYQSSFVESRAAESYVSATQGPTLVPGGGVVNVVFGGLRREPTATGVPIASWDGTYYTAADAALPTDATLFTLKYKYRLNITVTGGTVDIALYYNDLPFSGEISNVGTGTHVFENDTDLVPGRYIGNSASGFSKVSVNISVSSGTPTVTITAGSISIAPDGNVPSFNNFPAVYHAAILPEMSQAELLKEIAISYGLIFEEKNNIVYAKSFDEIIDDRANARDWTAKRIPKDQDIKFTPLEYGQRNLFKYTEGNGGEFLGAGEFDVANANVDPEKTIFTSEFTNTESIVKDGILMADLPVYDEIDTAFGFLKFSSGQGNKMLLIRDPYAGEPNVTYPDSVAYGDYKVAYFDDPDQDDTMSFQQDIDENYPLLIECLQKAKIVERDYLLTELDIANFSFLYPIYDSGQYYLVNEIKDFIESGVRTRVEIFKV